MPRRQRVVARQAMPYVAAVVSGLLLAAAFPPLERGAAAWAGLVPLLLAVRGLRPGAAARIGFVAGTVFWLFSLHWLALVTAVGWVLLALYCALYAIPTAVVVGAWTRRFGTASWAANLGLMAVATATWTGFEYLRSVLLTGFPWNALGVSQYRQIALIQAAAWGGVFAVSALVVWVNLAAALTLCRWGEARRSRWRGPHPELMLALLAVAVFLVTGRQSILHVPQSDGSLRLGLVQPAIPQKVKWTEAFIDETYRRLAELSRAASAARPDLLVWPETAVPEDLRSVPQAYALVCNVVSNGIPLLVGSLDSTRDDAGRWSYFNSSFLIGPGGVVEQEYDKQHLVILGEYLPFHRYLPFLSGLSPIPYDITPGTNATVFALGPDEVRFSVLICFEDAFPYLSRRFVKAGARVLVTQTNDAWFDFSSGSRQHLRQSVFRCVENRVAMARCGNTGMTCWIDSLGRIGGAGREVLGLLPNYGPGPVALSGFLTATLPLRAAETPETFYARHGDLFAGACAAIGIAAFLAALLRRPRAG